LYLRAVSVWRLTKEGATAPAFNPHISQYPRAECGV
jgi:hypothetical protein